MKVLIISHTVFSASESMGKTLSTYFSTFSPDELAQFYIHSQVPTSEICHNYYRITDKEALLSVLGRKCGAQYKAENIELGRVDARTDRGMTASLYQKARKRTPLIYLARNLWWRLAQWNTPAFRHWIDDFNPDCVFFASGDYAFMYDIARSIASYRKIPLYVSCMDDYYTYNKNSGSLLGRLQHRLFMKSVRKTMDYASTIFCICEKMSEDYATLFQKRCVTVHTPCSISHPLELQKKAKISYLGNLGLQRDKSLIAIGQALKSLGLQPDCIDVYSTESRREILDAFSEENGIRFHGAVSAAEVLEIMGQSLAIIHTESFDETIRQSVRYSVSTKIADSLASGTCIFAYGPEEIASISYLNEAGAAVCCTKPEELENQLKQLIQNDMLRAQTVKNALRLAQVNHAPSVTPAILRAELNR